MRRMGSISPQPLPPSREAWSLSASLIAVAVGGSLTLESFHDAGAIGHRVYEACLFFVWAVSIGAITGLIHERRTHLDVQRSVLRNLPIFETLTGSEARERMDGEARKKKAFFWSRKKKRL